MGYFVHIVEYGGHIDPPNIYIYIFVNHNYICTWVEASIDYGLIQGTVKGTTSDFLKGGGVKITFTPNQNPTD